MTLAHKTPHSAPVLSESSVRKKAAESEALFLSIGEGAIVTDAGGKVSRINQEALNILGYTAPELIGKWYPAIVIAEDESGDRIPNIDRPITEVFLSGKSVFKKLYYRRKDGSRIPVALTVSPVVMQGKPVGAIEVFRDIGEEIRLEKAKDEFIALASHQLRTPATGVKQYAGMLLEGYAGELNESQLSMVKNIYESNERQINIINDLLKVAQVDAGQVQLMKKKIDLVELIHDIINEQQHKFKSRSQVVKFNHHVDQAWSVVDRNRMRMALENIIDNASKYTPEHKQISVIATDSTNAVTIEVKDEGVGIPQDEIELIFEKFIRLDNPLSMAVGGTGLGLYWVKKIIDLHGATLEVQSKPSTGTSFIITIPRLPEDM